MNQAITDLTNAVNNAVAALNAAKSSNDDAQVEVLAKQLQDAIGPAQVAVTTPTPTPNV